MAIENDKGYVVTHLSESEISKRTLVATPQKHCFSEWVLIYQNIPVHFMRSQVDATEELEAVLDKEHKASVRADNWPEDLGEWSMVTATKYLLQKLFPT